VIASLIIADSKRDRDGNANNHGCCRGRNNETKVRRNWRHV